MDKSDIGITFLALFGKATTTVDGGWSITFQVSQDEAERVLQLSQYREQALQVAVVPFEQVERNRFRMPDL